MKAHLLFPDRDFDTDREPPANEPALTQDLGLGTLFAAMGGDDTFLTEVAGRVVLSGLSLPDTITYRQRILHDCLAQPEVVRQIYALAVEAVSGEKRIWRARFSRYPAMILHREVEVLGMFVGILKRLRRISDKQAGGFRSEGFIALFEMLTRELDDAYFQVVEEHLLRLRFNRNVLVSAELGKGNKGTNYILRTPNPVQGGWFRRLTARDRSVHTWRLPDRDESGARALGELRGRGINLAANALAQSTDHILSFLTMLRFELGFYIGCLNLHERLVEQGEPVCVPVPLAVNQCALSASGLYDVGLSLRVRRRVVGNDVNADSASLVMITGANQGGKSTFLRSVGLAQLMMQCGMFTPAESFSANVCEQLFTHFKREEDATMTSGKLDEELARMSEIADSLSPNSMVLFNESFASTTEREGSEIARQIIQALVENGIKVFFVTHLYDLAHNPYLHQQGTALFLRAQRHDDGQRTFRLVEGAPLPTSYGKDLYKQIFGSISQQPDIATTSSNPALEDRPV